MTANQLIALLFPIGTAIGAGLTGWLAKKIWVDRPVEEPRVQFRAVTDIETEALEAIAEAEGLIEKAHRDLEQARIGLQRVPNI